VQQLFQVNRRVVQAGHANRQGALQCLAVADIDGLGRDLLAQPLGDQNGAARAVSGNITANSSPPRRPAISASRSALRICSETAASTRSPVRWPWLSLTRLKWSMSTISNDSLPP
jgi:hypothetical protein